MAVLATSCLSVLSSVLVLSIHHQRGRPNRAPLWLRKFCFSIITPLFRLPARRDLALPGDITTSSTTRRLRPVVKRETMFKKGHKVATSSRDESECVRMNYTEESDNCDDLNDVDKKDMGNNTYQQVYTPSNHFYSTHKKSYAPLRQTTNYTLDQRQHDQPTHRHRITLEDTEATMTESSFSQFANHEEDGGDSGTLPESHAINEEATCAGSRSGYTYNLMVTYLVNLIQTIRQVELRDEEIFKEWHDVAYVLDRLLFCLFFLITLLSTVCILEMRPPKQTI